MINPKSLENLQKTGRPKGTKNKFTSLKASFLDAFEAAGGREFLIAFAKDKRNQAAFLNMLARMLPNKVESDVSMSGRVQIVEIPAKLPKGQIDRE